MILTSYLYVGVHYKKNNRVSIKLAPVSVVTLLIQAGPAFGWGERGTCPGR
jgi:hypothetical protein